MRVAKQSLRQSTCHPAERDRLAAAVQQALEALSALQQQPYSRAAGNDGVRGEQQHGAPPSAADADRVVAAEAQRVAAAEAQRMTALLLVRLEQTLHVSLRAPQTIGRDSLFSCSSLLLA